jgi:hypothetical protein
MPCVVAPIRDSRGNAIAALGIFDVVGTVDLGALFADYPKVLERVRAYHTAERG